MSDKDWITVKIPKSLTSQIDQVLKANKTYKSRAELVREAVQDYLASQRHN